MLSAIHSLIDFLKTSPIGEFFYPYDVATGRQERYTHIR